VTTDHCCSALPLGIPIVDCTQFVRLSDCLMPDLSSRLVQILLGPSCVTTLGSYSHLCAFVTKQYKGRKGR